MIIDATSEVYKGKNKSGQTIEKGIAFPVCVVAHCSPLASEVDVSIIGCIMMMCVLFYLVCKKGKVNGTRDGETLFPSGRTAVL